MNIHKKLRTRILSAVLTAAMLCTMIPSSVFATPAALPGVSGMAECHTEHDADCGYQENIIMGVCTHEHDDDCGYDEGMEEAPCQYIPDEDAAGALEAEEHVHDEACGYKEEIPASECAHEHDEKCGYGETLQVTAPCAHSCEICRPAETEKAECSCTALCTQEVIDESCPVCVESSEGCVYKAEEPTCQCSEPCTAEAVNEGCLVCTDDIEKCVQKEELTVKAVIDRADMLLEEWQARYEHSTDDGVKEAGYYDEAFQESFVEQYSRLSMEADTLDGEEQTQLREYDNWLVLCQIGWSMMGYVQSMGMAEMEALSDMPGSTLSRKVYTVNSDTAITGSEADGNGLEIASGETAVVFIPGGVTLTVEGIGLPGSSALLVTGGGTLNVIAADGSDGIGAGAFYALGNVTVEAAGGAAMAGRFYKAPTAMLRATDSRGTDDTGFTKLEIREGSAGGELVVDLLDSASVAEGWSLTPGPDYYLCVEMNRDAGTDYVQLRYGSSAGAYNGVTYANPPGGGFVEQPIGHDFFDELVKYTNFDEPVYGSGNAKLSLRDGRMLYHIKAGQTKINFSVGLVVNDAVYDGSGSIPAAIEVSLGSYEADIFNDVFSKEIDLKIKEKNAISSFMYHKTATAELGIVGNTVYARALINSDDTQQAAVRYETFTIDVTYPAGANLEYGFTADFSKKSIDYGTMSLAEGGTESVIDGITMVTRRLTLENGYKEPKNTVNVHFRLDFPDNGSFTAGAYKLMLSNQTLTMAGGAELALETEGKNQAVIYTVTAAGSDATSMAAVNRANVYNHTIDMDAGDYLVPLGNASIKNSSAGLHSPYEKTFEAAYNITGTAAKVTAVTIPLGDKAEPVITWEGREASGAVRTGTLTQEQVLGAAYKGSGSLEDSLFLLIYARDLGIDSFTGITAEIGRLRPAYVSIRSTVGWTFDYNRAGAFGHFTTAENGIEVKNTFKLYNTQDSLRDRENGDLSVTTSAVSTNMQRVGVNATEPKLGNVVINTDSSVAAGSTAKISGTVYAYIAPQATKDISVSPILYATSMYLKDPVLYLTLPSGLTPDQSGISFTLTNYNDREKKLSESGKLDYHLVQTENSGGITTYQITLPEGTGFGFYDGEGNYSYLNYSIAFATEKSLPTQRYRLNDLITLTTRNGFQAMRYEGINNGVLVTVKADEYGLNNGKGEVSGIAKDKDDAPKGFGVQQQAEVVVESAISVSKVNDTPVKPEWASYSSSNPNSVSMMGNSCEGQVRLNIKNTSDITGSDFKLLLPVPQKDMNLGSIFMTGSQGFALSMQNVPADGSSDGFEVRYARIDGSFEELTALWDGTDTYQTVTDPAEANALLITAASIAKGNYTLYFDYSVSEGEAGANNVWQPAYVYTVEGESRQKVGGAVAGSVAGSKISGIVFADGDGNGIMDGSDSGVSGIKVTAIDAQGRTAGTTTDAEGRYEFTAVRESEITLTFTVGNGETLRFNVQPNASGAGVVSSVAPSQDGLSASHSFHASGAGTVNAAMSGFVKLSYDGNGSTAGVLPASSEYLAGQSAAAAVKPDNLKKTGYKFTGWNTLADGTGTAYQPGAIFNMTGDMVLYAQWEITDYLITFNYRGATGNHSEGSRRVLHNTRYGGGVSGAYTNPLPVPTKTGYEFKGWTRIVTATTANVRNDTRFILGADTILYALWAPKSGYTIKYDTGGGSLIPDKTDAAWNATLLPAAAPVKTGFVFGGWRHTDSGTAITSRTYYSDLAADDTVTEVTLTAVWRAKTGYTVTYDANGGTGTLFDKTGLSWTEHNLLPDKNPTRESFAFDGWRLGDTERTVTAADSYGALAGTDDVPSVTLKAAWKELTDNMVRYDAEGGTTVPDKTGVKAGDAVLAGETTTRQGYRFEGWYYGGTRVEESTRYSELAVFGETSVTLTAKWEQKKYTVEYQTGNGTTIEKITDKTWLDGGLLPSAALTKDGYSFEGWYYNGGMVMESDTVSSLIPEDDADTLTLTAKWLERAYTIRYDTRGGNYISPRSNMKYTSRNLLPDVSAVRTGYTLESWTAQVGTETKTVTDGTALSELIAAGESAQIVTLTANWTARGGYTVSYDTNGGTAVADKTGVGWEDAGLLPAGGSRPTRGGYELTGWLCGRTVVTDATLFGEIASSDADGASVTVVAQWAEKSSYTVRYLTGSETNIGDKTGVRWNQRLLLPSVNPERAGYAFLGWAVNAGESGEKMVSNTDSYAGLVTDASQSVLILTAKWEEKKHYLVKFDTDGGGSIPDKGSVFNESMANLLPEQAPVKYGYAFEGWSYMAEGGRETVVTSDMTYADLAGRDTVESITLTARWRLKGYTVRYDTDGAGEIEPLENVRWTDAPVLPDSDPVKTGYRVAGWYYEGRKVEPGDSLGDVIQEDSEELKEITLKLSWEERVYTIHYNTEGGTAVADRDVAYTADNLLPDSASYRKGYTLSGWYYGDTAVKAPGTDVKELLGGSADSMSELTLTARWTAITGYQVHYDTSGDSFAESRTDIAWTTADLTPIAAPTKPGHSLTGWRHGGTEVTASTVFGDLSESDTPGSAITLTAVWTEKADYTVKYDKNGAAGADIPDRTNVKWTQKGLLPASNPERRGYAFNGWSCGDWQATSETDYATLAGMDDTVVSVTLKALWVPIRDNTVKYDTDGGSVLADRTGVTWDDAGLLPEAPEKPGYTFAGWLHNTTPVTEKTRYGELALTEATKEITLKAKWTPKVYTVTYDTGGGTAIEKKTDVKWADRNLLPTSDPTRQHYVFAGWSCGGVSVTNETALESLAADDTCTGVTLTAQWTKKEYTVKYDTDGGSPIADKTVYWDKGVLLPDATPMKPGHSFSHWECGGIAVTDSMIYSELAASSASPPESLTLTAVYAPAVENTGNVEGTIIAGDGGQPLENIYVSIHIGGTGGTKVIGAVSTGQDGKFSFYGIPYGIYTLVATRTSAEGQEQVITKTITVSDVTADGSMTMPGGFRNTIVEVKPGTPPVAADKLEALFEESNQTADGQSGVTASEHQIADAGGSLEIKLTVERKDAQDSAITEDIGKIQSELERNYTLLPFDLSVVKTVTDKSSGITQTRLKQLPTLIDIVIPLQEVKGKSLRVLRVHEGEVHALPYTDGALTETFEYRDEHLHLQARMFSTYVIAYADGNEGGSNNGGSNNGDSNNGDSNGGGGNGGVSGESSDDSSDDGDDPGDDPGSGGGTLYHIITASSGEGGSIYPSGRIRVKRGESVAFFVAAREGYAVDMVKVDGKPVGAVGQYMFINVRENHRIEASFRKTEDSAGKPEDLTAPEKPSDTVAEAVTDAPEAAPESGKEDRDNTENIQEAGKESRPENIPESGKESQPKDDPEPGKENRPEDTAETEKQAFDKQKEEMIVDLEGRLRETMGSLPDNLAEEEREAAVRRQEQAFEEAAEKIRGTDNAQEAADAYNQAVRNFEQIIADAVAEPRESNREPQKKPFILISALLALLAVLSFLLLFLKKKEEEPGQDRQQEEDSLREKAKRRRFIFRAAAFLGAAAALLTFLLTTGWNGIALYNGWTWLVAVLSAASAAAGLRSKKEDKENRNTD